MSSGKKTKAFSRVLLVIWLILLVWGVLFRFKVVPFSALLTGSSLNLVPFAGMFSSSAAVLLPQFFCCMAVFVPLGKLFTSLNKPKSVLGRVALGAAIGIALEAAQYVFGLGYSDITDVIAYALGTLLGVVIHVGTSKLMRARADMLYNVIILIIELMLIAFFVAQAITRLF